MRATIEELRKELDDAHASRDAALERHSATSAELDQSKHHAKQASEHSEKLAEHLDTLRKEADSFKEQMNSVA